MIQVGEETTEEQNERNRQVSQKLYFISCIYLRRVQQDPDSGDEGGGGAQEEAGGPQDGGGQVSGHPG